MLTHAKYSDRPWRTFLSQAGPQLNVELLKLSITFWLSVVDLPSETKKATHWVALSCGGVVRGSSARTSREGRIHWRTVASGRSHAGRAGSTRASPVQRGKSIWSEEVTYRYQLVQRVMVTHD